LEKRTSLVANWPVWRVLGQNVCVVKDAGELHLSRVEDLARVRDVEAVRGTDVAKA
jgi:hypothetical protein